MVITVLVHIIVIGAMAVVALIPWIGFSNFFSSTSTTKKERQRTVYMPIYKNNGGNNDGKNS